MEVDDLVDVAMPAIIHWDFNHFLVVEGSDDKWVYLNDPAQGHRHVTHQEFFGSFTGIVMSFTPTETFEKTKSNSTCSQLSPGTFLFFSSYLEPFNFLPRNFMLSIFFSS